MGTLENEDEVPMRELRNRNKISSWLINNLKRRVPIVEWLPKYHWKENFLPDLMAGITVACIHIPQGMAFALLANVKPILGLYTSCFSTFVYCLLGTAHVGSFGPVAVASMLTGEAVLSESGKGYSPEELASFITFMIGIYYMVAFLLKLGVITAIFSKPFTSGFIAGCTTHIIVKNMKLLLGLDVKTYYGLFDLYHNAVILFSHLKETNIPTLIIAVVVLILLTGNGLLLKPLVRKCTKVIFPVEAIIMLMASGFSYWFSFDSMGVKIVGTVPTGLPAVAPLQFSAFSIVWSHSLAIAIVNYATTASMTMAFNKELNADQDLFALAASNLLCSNIQCITIGNSMMRTAIAVTLGTRTLLSSIISSFLLFWVILFVGPIFSPLPSCVLGCVILVGAVLLIWARIKEIPIVFKSGFENAVIWLGAFLVVVAIGIQYGLVVGAILSLRQILSDYKSCKIQVKAPLPEEKQLMSPTDNGAVSSV